MTIYEHTTSLLVSGGTNNTLTLNIFGGLCRYVLVRANTATTIFRANLVDENGIRRLDYGYHEGEIVDDKLSFPMVGVYKFSITNSSPDDTFRIILSIQE